MTFAKARTAIWKTLEGAGWKMSDPALKVPHATAPSGSFRLWFKPQAVYYSEGRPPFAQNDARSLWLDIRELDGPRFLALVTRYTEKK
jgi:hypothetical protein